MNGGDGAELASEQSALSWVRDLMRPFQYPWWVCGGWAVDLHLGCATRSHGDIDIAVDAHHASHLASVLADWDVIRTDFLTKEQTPWHGEGLRPGPDILTLPGAPYPIEILAALVENGEWVFPRGSHRIRRDGSAAFLTSKTGLPYQAPEIVLLYKARQLRDKDDADFEALLPTLDAGQRAWLAEVIPPDHPWAARLTARTSAP